LKKRKNNACNIKQTDHASPLFARRTKPPHAKSGLARRLFVFVRCYKKKDKITIDKQLDNEY